MKENKILFVTFSSTVNAIYTNKDGTEGVPITIQIKENEELNRKLSEGWSIEEVKFLGTHTQSIVSETLTQITTALYYLSKEVNNKT